MDSVNVENVSFVYSGGTEKSLENIDFQIKKGEFTVISGDSRSGKTSLLYLISGIIPFFYSGNIEGRVMVCGTPVEKSSMEEIKRKVRIVLNNPYAQISGMSSTVFEEVALGINERGLNRREIEDKVDEALFLSAITDLKERNPSSLSGGETQKMVIAGQLVSDYEVLLLDEPVSKLDPEGKTGIFKLAEKLARTGKSVVVTGNEIERAAVFSDRIILLADGRIVKDGSAREISSDPDIENHGVELQRYTKAAQLGMEKGLWRKEKRLPSTFEEACEGFGWISD